MKGINTRLGITGEIGIGEKRPDHVYCNLITGETIRLPPAATDYFIRFKHTTFGSEWTMEMTREEMTNVCGGMITTLGIKTKESEYLALKAENRRLTGELEQVYERLNDLTEKIKNIAEKHNIKPTNVENLRENDIN